MFLWGEADMLWTEGLADWWRARRRRRLVAAQGAVLVAEAEAWLAAGGELSWGN